MGYGMEHQLSRLIRENGARAFAGGLPGGQRHVDRFDSFSLLCFCLQGVILIWIYHWHSFKQEAYTTGSKNST